jgi:hypothetical protein
MAGEMTGHLLLDGFEHGKNPTLIKRLALPGRERRQKRAKRQRQERRPERSQMFVCM